MWLNLHQVLAGIHQIRQPAVLFRQPRGPLRQRFRQQRLQGRLPAQRLSQYFLALCARDGYGVGLAIRQAQRLIGLQLAHIDMNAAQAPGDRLLSQRGGAAVSAEVQVSEAQQEQRGPPRDLPDADYATARYWATTLTLAPTLTPITARRRRLGNRSDGKPYPSGARPDPRPAGGCTLRKSGPQAWATRT